MRRKPEAENSKKRVVTSSVDHSSYRKALRIKFYRELAGRKDGEYGVFLLLLEAALALLNDSTLYDDRSEEYFFNKIFVVSLRVLDSTINST